MVEPTRELLWGVEELHVTAHYLYFLIAGVLFLFGLFRLYKIVKAGRNDENRLDNLPARFVTALKDSVLFVRLFMREAKMGLMHVLILWGVAILMVGTAVLTIADHVTSEFFRGMFYLIHEALMDIAGIAFLAGLLIAFVNRYILRPSRFAKKWPHATDDGGVLLGLAVVALLGFMVEALRIASGYPAYTAFIGGLLASVFPFDISAYRAVWVAHSILALTLVAIVPYTKLLHAIAAPLNILTRTERVGAREIGDEEYMGAVKAKGFAVERFAFEPCMHALREVSG